VSPTKQANGESGKESKVQSGDSVTKQKTWEKPGSVGDQFSSVQMNKHRVIMIPGCITSQIVD